jgi:hypothetical protein
MEDGKEKVNTEHPDISEDDANGMILTLLKNMSSSTSETKEGRGHVSLPKMVTTPVFSQLSGILAEKVSESWRSKCSRLSL